MDTKRTAASLGANLNFMNSDSGKQWEKDVKVRAQEIFDGKVEFEKALLKGFSRDFANCFKEYSGRVTSQEVYGVDWSLQSFYPYLSVGDRTPITAVTRLKLNGIKSFDFVVPMNLVDLRDKEIKMISFVGSKNLLRYLGEDNSSISGNMTSTPGRPIYHGRETPLIYCYTPSDELYSDGLKVLNVSNLFQGCHYYASLLPREFDFKDPENYVCSELVQTDSNKRLFGECREEAKKEISREDYGYKASVED